MKEKYLLSDRGAMHWETDKDLDNEAVWEYEGRLHFLSGGFHPWRAYIEALKEEDFERELGFFLKEESSYIRRFLHRVDLSKVPPELVAKARERLVLLEL